MQIKDVEKLTGLSAKSIRLYEEKGLIEIERNRDNAYREYSKENLDVLREIKVLRYLDFSIAEIKDLLKAPPEVMREMLVNKEKEYHNKINDYNKKMDICNLLKKDCMKTEHIREVFQEYEETIPVLEDAIEAIQELKCLSMFEMICFSLMCLGPILWLFINMVDEKWSAFAYNIPLALITTVMLTLKWNNYFRKYKFNKDKMKAKNRHTGLKMLGIVFIIFLSIAVFAMVEKMLILFYAPETWLFYSVDEIAIYMFIILVELPLIIAFFALFNKKDNQESQEEQLEIPQKNRLKGWKFLLAFIWCFFIYVCISNNTFVTEDTIIYHNWLHPLGIQHSYSDVSMIKTGFGTKTFTIKDSNKKGHFYYHILVKGKWIDFSSTYPNENIEKYEDIYLEIEDFDKVIMKYQPEKISNDIEADECDLAEVYVERYLKIINNK
jgi:DNA-binding transcriptional MerR regulator